MLADEITTMYQVLVFASLLVCALTQGRHADRPIDHGPPRPYSFSTIAKGPNGTTTHEETGDAEGNKKGKYTLSTNDGRNRVVEYIADALGYRVKIQTNEPGTKNESPADVDLYSSYEKESHPQGGRYVLVSEDYLKRNRRPEA